MESPAFYFQEKIYSYFLREDQCSNKLNRDYDTFIKFHNERLKEMGDVSFSATLDIWLKHFNGSDVSMSTDALKLLSGNTDCAVDEGIVKFLQFASEWIYPVENAKYSNKRLCLFLNRKAIFGMVIAEVLANNNKFGQLKKDTARTVRVHMEMNNYNCDDLSQYRAILISKALIKILDYSNWTLTSDSSKNNALNVLIHSIGKHGTNDDLVNSGSNVKIKCGLVLDPKTKKMSTISTEDYQKLRSNELHLVALHKYGYRMREDDRFRESLKIIGNAAVKFDLLEVKHSSPVQTRQNDQGSTKGASFILYNSARLESLLRTFNQRVKSAAYTKLPDIDEIDFSLLNEEQEWQLLFGYILDFPNLIGRCVSQLEHGIISTHLIIRYLSSFVSVFSCYYRRTRIITEYREHLMPRIFARMYLIKAVRETLNNALALFDVDPVMFM